MNSNPGRHMLLAFVLLVFVSAAHSAEQTKADTQTTTQEAPSDVAGATRCRALTQDLNGEDNDARWKAVEALGDMGLAADCAVPALTKLLGDMEDVQSSEGASNIKQSLLKIGTPAAMGALKEKGQREVKATGSTLDNESGASAQTAIPDSGPGTTLPRGIATLKLGESAATEGLVKKFSDSDAS